MAPELLRIERIDCWPPARPDGVTVWIIKGETVEADPRRVTVKTIDAWKAALLERMQATQRYAWVTWRGSLRGDVWLQTVAPDETRFVAEAVS